MPRFDWQSSFHPSYLFMVQGLLFLFNSQMNIAFNFREEMSLIKNRLTFLAERLRKGQPYSLFLFAANMYSSHSAAIRFIFNVYKPGIREHPGKLFHAGEILCRFLKP